MQSERKKRFQDILDVMEKYSTWSQTMANVINKLRQPTLEDIWIRQDVGLPGDNEEVLLTIHDPSGWYCTIGWRNGDYWYFDDDLHDQDEVLAWMPLPEPYKEDV